MGEAQVVRRRQQMPQGFVCSAKDTASMRWETTGEYWVEEWNLLLHVKSIPLAAVWRTGYRESRVEAGWFRHSYHSLKHILRALQSGCMWRTYIQTELSLKANLFFIIRRSHSHCRKLEKNRKICIRKKCTNSIPSRCKCCWHYGAFSSIHVVLHSKVHNGHVHWYPAWSQPNRISILPLKALFILMEA